MKLNLDVVRELMLWLEDGLTLCYDGRQRAFVYTPLDYTDFVVHHDEIAPEDVIYTSKMLSDGGYIEAQIDGCDETISICRYYSLTYEGHKLLDSIRDEGRWKELKRISYDLKGAGLEIIGAVGAELIKNAALSMVAGRKL